MNKKTPSEKLNAHAFHLFEYREPLRVLDWAESSVELSPRITEQPGPYSSRLYPYVTEILETIRDPNVKRVSLCWGSQTAKTTSFYIMLGFVIDQRPQPILWVFPNAVLCKAFASDRWMPFCRESQVIRKHIPRNSEGGIDTDRFTLQKQEFDRCTMNLVGAESSANVRSYPIAVLVLDEIDVIPEAIRRECLDRVKGKHDFKILQSSTPITEAGGIWQEFQEGDRRRFYVPCPHCDEMMIFRWKDGEGELNLRWADNAKNEDGTHDLGMVAASAFYRCENCAGEIHDLHKFKAMKSGKWVAATKTAEPGARSYHLNSFYSPTLTFGRIAVEFLKAQATVDGMRAFVNGWLAEPWKPDTGGTINPDAFKELQGDYERGEKKGDYRIIAADVQRDHFVWIIRGFDKDGQSYLIDNGTCPSFEDFAPLAKNYGVAYGIIDTGYRTQEIYEEIHAARPFWFGAKGWEKMPTSYRIAKLDPFTPDQKRSKASSMINLLHVNKDTWGQEMLKKRSGAAMNWQVYRGIEVEYVRQMLSTNLIERVNQRGKSKLEWHVEGHRADHFWDCETYCLALSHVFGLGGAVMRKAGEAAPTPKRRPRKPKPAAPSSFWG